MPDEMTDLLINQAEETRNVKRQLGELAKVTGIQIEKEGVIKCEVKRYQVDFKNIAGETMIWGNSTFGIWGSSKWGSTSESSFILGSSVAGLLGISPLGSQSSEFELQEVSDYPGMLGSKLSNWYEFQDLDGNDSLADSYGSNDGTVLVRATAYYPFNGNANDESTSGNDGTVIGATLTTDRFGVAEKAYYFDGVNDYIDVGNNDLNLGTQATWSFWVKRNSWVSGGGVIEKYAAIDGHRSWLIRDSVTETNSLVMSMSQNGVANDTQASNNNFFVNDEWVFGTVTFNNGVINFYRNGVSWGTKTSSITSLFVNSPRAISIGRNGGSYFNGKIDEVIILPVALTATEVAALYELTNRHDWNDVFVDGKFEQGAEMLMVGQVNGAPNYGPYIELGSNIEFSPTAGSISWWYKTDSTKTSADGCHRIFCQSVDSTSGRIDIDVNGKYFTANTVRWESKTNNVWEESFSTGIDVDDGSWHHYVLTAGTSNTKLYVDGTLTDTKTANDDTVNQLFKYIGSYETSIYNYGSGLQGSIDEVLFFKKELSSSDVLVLYNASGKVVD